MLEKIFLCLSSHRALEKWSKNHCFVRLTHLTLHISMTTLLKALSNYVTKQKEICESDHFNEFNLALTPIFCPAAGHAIHLDHFVRPNYQL